MVSLLEAVTPLVTECACVFVCFLLKSDWAEIIISAVEFEKKAEKLVLA